MIDCLCRLIGWDRMTNGTKRQLPDVKDKELVEYATNFLNAYAASAENSQGKPNVASAKGFPLGAGGIVELTEHITEAQSGFVLQLS